MSKITLAALLLFTGPMMVQAAGTGVGNGTDGTESVNQVIIQIDLNTKEIKGPMQDQNLDQLMAEVGDWCIHSARQLKRLKQRAATLINQGLYKEANELIKTGLGKISDSYKLTGKAPLTKKVIDRALNYAYRIGLAEDSQFEQLSMVNLLSSYLDFIEDVSELDRSHYISYEFRHGRCHSHCHDFNMEEFTRRYLKVAGDELSLINDRFTTGSGSHIFPFGSQKLYLKLAELASNLIANDIGDTLARYRLSCQIVDLKNLSESLAYFNQGDRSEWRNYPIAVKETHRAIGEVARALGGGSHPNGEFETKQLISYRTMADNLNLYLSNQPVMVKRIFGDAEAIRREGSLLIYSVSYEYNRKKFDKIAEIPFPARDPHFSFAWNGYAQELELRSKAGGGKIQMNSFSVELAKSTGGFPGCHY